MPTVPTTAAARHNAPTPPAPRAPAGASTVRPPRTHQISTPPHRGRSRSTHGPSPDGHPGAVPVPRSPPTIAEHDAQIPSQEDDFMDDDPDPGATPVGPTPGLAPAPTSYPNEPTNSDIIRLLQGFRDDVFARFDRVEGAADAQATRITSIETSIARQDATNRDVLQRQRRSRRARRPPRRRRHLQPAPTGPAPTSATRTTQTRRSSAPTSNTLPPPVLSGRAYSPLSPQQASPARRTGGPLHRTTPVQALRLTMPR